MYLGALLGFEQEQVVRPLTYEQKRPITTGLSAMLERALESGEYGGAVIVPNFRRGLSNPNTLEGAARLGLYGYRLPPSVGDTEAEPIKMGRNYDVPPAPEYPAITVGLSALLTEAIQNGDFDDGKPANERTVVLPTIQELILATQGKMSVNRAEELGLFDTPRGVTPLSLQELINGLVIGPDDHIQALALPMGRTAELKLYDRRFVPVRGAE